MFFLLLQWNRRPQLPVQSTPLTEDDEMTWPDACVDSEPALDDNVAPDVIDDKHQPLRHLLLAFGGFSALIFGIKSYLSTQSPVGNYAAVRKKKFHSQKIFDLLFTVFVCVLQSSREYPFDNLRVEMGGRNGKP